MAQTSERVYEDFEPVSDLLSEKDCDTLLLHLPDFKKEHLKVQQAASILRVFGEHPIGGNKWKRFHKEFQVPSNIEMKGMSAKLEGGILYIRQPKVIEPEAKEEQDQGKTAAEAPAPEHQQEAPYTAPQQQQAPDLPQPQLPQPQLQPEPQKGFEEEKTRRNGYEYDAARKEEKGEITKKGEEGKDQCEFKEGPKQMGGIGGFFQELKPENLKRLVVSVLLVLSIGFYATYKFKSFAGR